MDGAETAHPCSISTEVGAGHDSICCAHHRLAAIEMHHNCTAETRKPSTSQLRCQRPGNKVYPRIVTYKQLPRSCGGTTSLLSNLLFPLLSIMRVLQISWKLETSDSTDFNWPRTPVHVIWRFERLELGIIVDSICYAVHRSPPSSPAHSLELAPLRSSQQVLPKQHRPLTNACGRSPRPACSRAHTPS